ncbi:DMT family transporter [bacterium]|nr:DMT family transporter [bacterium]
MVQGRILILAAAILWSTSGAFVKFLDMPAGAIAMDRTLVATLFLAAYFASARRLPTFHPVMIVMMICFSMMNYTFVASLTLTSSANSVFLQYTSPLWIALGGLAFLGEPLDRKSLVAVSGSLIGVVIIVATNRQVSAGEQWGMILGLTSGIFYAGAALSLRFLRDHDPRWLAFLNHLGAGTSLLIVNMIGVSQGWISPEVFYLPTEPTRLAVLIAFGILQMGLPYVLFARGLSVVPAKEAGILTLIEPVLNPIWAFLIARDLPTSGTLVGGAILLTSLLWQYWPLGKHERGR